MDCQLSDDTIVEDNRDENLTEINGIGDGDGITCIGGKFHKPKLEWYSPIHMKIIKQTQRVKIMYKKN